MMLLLAVAAGGASTGCQAKRESPRVRIRGQEWFVDTASTNQQRYDGLSGREALGEKVGMLFVYRRPQVLRFCMRGCLVPLDVAFLDADRRIVKIHTMEVEADRVGRETYGSDGPAQYALEVAGGALGRAGVNVGDVAEFLGDMPDPTKAEEGP